MTSRSLSFLFLSFGTLALASGTRPVHDYIFSITGVVTAEDRTPLQDAEVNLDVNGPVYEGVTLIKTVKRTTDDTGGFVFTYTSHQRGVKYTITVRKEGFEAQTVSGSAPPDGHHTIRTKKHSSTL